MANMGDPDIIRNEFQELGEKGTFIFSVFFGSGAVSYVT